MERHNELHLRMFSVSVYHSYLSRVPGCPPSVGFGCCPLRRADSCVLVRCVPAKVGALAIQKMIRTKQFSLPTTLVGKKTNPVVNRGNPRMKRIHGAVGILFRTHPNAQNAPPAYPPDSPTLCEFLSTTCLIPRSSTYSLVLILK